MRLLGILAAGLMATACGLSFNPDLPQADGDGGNIDTGGPGNGASAGDGDQSGFPDGGEGDPCSSHSDRGAGGMGGFGGESPDPAGLTIHPPCPEEGSAR